MKKARHWTGRSVVLMFGGMDFREANGRKALTRWCFSVLLVFVLLGLLSAHFIWVDRPTWALFWLYGLIVIVPALAFIGYRVSARIFAGQSLDSLERDIVGPIAIALFVCLLLFAISAIAYGSP